MSFPSVRLEDVVASGGALLFLSAHLDDAVLSCGGLIAELAGRCSVTVATLFTAPGPPPHTYAARSFLRQCAAPDAAGLYTARQAEDREVLTGGGVRPVHLGVTDALFRARDGVGPLAPLGRFVPELVHRYPTFRYDIAKGRVSRGDRALTADLTRQVGDLAEQLDAGLVFAPIGVGNHVDHLITRAVGERLGHRVVFYSDFPYDERAEPDAGFVGRHRLRSWTWNGRIPEKHRLIRGYRTQVDALFPGGHIPEKPETYFDAS